MSKEHAEAEEMAHRPEAAASRRADERETRWERISANLKTIGGAVLLALIIRTILFEAFEIEGPSMEPTLLNGDRVVVAKFTYGLFLPLQKEATFSWGMPDLGDVVIIKSPADGVDIVKRVIGLPGDLIEIRQEIVYRNGEPTAVRDLGPCEYGRGSHNPHCRLRKNQIDGITFRTSSATPMYNDMRVRIPEGEVFVLGDHRDSSNDSRAIGTIPIDRIKGKALAIYWSSGPSGLRTQRLFEPVQ